MRIIENCYDLICSPENIWRAWTEYRKGKRSRRVVREFEYNLEENLLNLAEELNNGAYCHGGYSKFVVHDPKQRIISAPSVKDHIVHQAIHNALFPFFDRIFLPFSFSCRKNKGTYLAVIFLQRYLRQVSHNYREDCWVLHGDIKKCFDSINHKILLTLLNRRIHCDKTMDLMKKIIDSYHAGIDNETERHGIPLGNLTSQIFINIYLHELDFFTKEKLLVKHYVRYADDFMLIFKSRQECEKFAEILRKFLKTELKLDFPPTHQKITKLSRGVETLGTKFLPFYRKIKWNTFRRSERLFLRRCHEYAEGIVTADALNASWQSLMGMLRYGHNIKLAEKLINLADVYV